MLTSVWTFPEPPIFAILNSLEKVFTNDVGLVGDFLRAVLPTNNVFEFCVVPAFHAFFILFLPGTSVREHILLGCLAFDRRIVREFALVPLFTFSLLKIDTSIVRRDFAVRRTILSLGLFRMGSFVLPGLV